MLISIVALIDKAARDIFTYEYTQLDNIWSINIEVLILNIFMCNNCKNRTYEDFLVIPQPKGRLLWST